VSKSAWVRGFIANYYTTPEAWLLEAAEMGGLDDLWSNLQEASMNAENGIGSVRMVEEAEEALKSAWAARSDERC
jgi:hypothetical protein